MTLFPPILGTALNYRFITVLTLIELSHPVGLDSLQQPNTEEISLLLSCSAPWTSMEMLQGPQSTCTPSPARKALTDVVCRDSWSSDTTGDLKKGLSLEARLSSEGLSQGLSLEIRSEQQVLEAKDKEVHQGVS